MYDRSTLLFGPRRDSVLDLYEIRRYGIDNFGDADYLSIYGMRPAAWYAAGVRIAGRTAVECTRDDLAGAIASDIAAVVASATPGPDVTVIDPFAGSGNTLYWILHHLPGSHGSAFESDATVFELTRQNVAALALPIDIANLDYAAGLATVTVPPDGLIVVFIAPPWGHALDPASGLDLRRTTPPIGTIVDLLVDRFDANRLLLAIQVCERLEPVALGELRHRFDWSEQHIYDFDAEGQNHGVLLGTDGWTPSGQIRPRSFHVDQPDS
jgi:hypothetical protein